MSGAINQALMIRVDTSTRIGTGHLMRCLALAQAWQDLGGLAVFVIAMEEPILEARLQSEGIEVVHLSVQPGSVEDATQTVYLARRREVSWIVIDGYQFGADYQRIIKDSGLLLLFIDDHGHAAHYYADIVLNQNIHAHEGLYLNRESYTRILLGTHYVLLRREFLRWKWWKRDILEVARKVLVTLGGCDPDNVTLKVIQALQQVEVKGLEVIVVVGGINPHYEELQSAIQHSQFTVRQESNVSNMPELMAWADVAVSSGGCTSWELAFMNLPGILVVLADNQRSVAQWLDARGVAINLGWHENLSIGKIAEALGQLLDSSEKRLAMVQCSRELVDGEGANRALRHMKGTQLRLRTVKEEDCRLLWEWANDPDVREASFSSTPIPWEQHVEWVKTKLNDPNCIFYIATNENGTPFGPVRYDIDGNEATVSINIDRKFRGQGYASTLIQLSTQKVFADSGVRLIHAYTKRDNKASVRAFEKAGYKKMGMKVVQGHNAVHLIRKKNR